MSVTPDSLDAMDGRALALRLAVDSLRPGHGASNPYTPSARNCAQRADKFLAYIESGEIPST